MGHKDGHIFYVVQLRKKGIGIKERERIVGSLPLHERSDIFLYAYCHIFLNGTDCLILIKRNVKMETEWVREESRMFHGIKWEQKGHSQSLQ